MVRLPTEILCAIFEQACTDDGHTGCALSLVSKHIRSISRRCALQSVAIYGPRQLSSFAAYLDTLSPQYRGVRYMYITDTPRVLMEHSPGHGQG